MTGGVPLLRRNAGVVGAGDDAAMTAPRGIPTRRARRLAAAAAATLGSAVAARDLGLQWVERTILQALERAAREGRFGLHYQPAYDLATRLPVGAEALMRLPGVGGVRLDPEDVIPIAERSGWIQPLGRRLLERSLREWSGRGGTLSINVSRSELHRPGYALELLCSRPPSMSLELEITETSAAPLEGIARANLEQLRRHGVTIALDDVGEGHNHLRLAAEFPCDRLKISRRLVSRIGRCRTGEALVRTISGLAAARGLPVTAEGIETEDQACWLRAHGCRTGQGFFFARPAPLAQLRLAA